MRSVTWATAMSAVLAGLLSAAAIGAEKPSAGERKLTKLPEGDLKRAVYPGPMREFFEGYFPADAAMTEVSAGVAPRAETAAERDRRMAWWREARFGMFIHWGPDAIPSLHWKDKPWNPPGPILKPAHESILNILPDDWQTQVIGKFNPVSYDPDAWVKLAKQAGMKYIVIITKHHNGFCMWPGLEGYDIRSTPHEGGPIGRLVAACRQHDMRVGFYFSQLDWHDPDAVGDHKPETYPQGWIVHPDQYLPRMKAQLRDLLTRYGRIDILWFDGDWIDDWTLERGRDLEQYLRNLQPDLILNDRVGKRTPHCGDFHTPEQQIPATGLAGVDWETCMTMNDTWFFVRQDQHWKSAQGLVRMLIETASKGGNFLLNVGPDADGVIPPPSVARLDAMGRWMQLNGESIHGTTASLFTKQLSWGRCTMKKLPDGKTRLYLHVFDWPKDGKLVVPGLANKVTTAYLLADPQRAPLRCEVGEDRVAVAVPTSAPDQYVSVIALDLAGPMKVVSPSVAADADGVFNLHARDADLHGGTLRYDGAAGRESIGYWTDRNDWVSWPVKVAKPGRYRVEIVYGCDKGSGGGEYAIEIGDQTLTAKAHETGGWFQRVTDQLGEVEIKSAGPHPVAIRLKSKPGVAVMDLQAVTLRPEK
ncbi:MAG: alpha-L-fucosidase [Chloroflexi bacterium]|nr:alpha-L-fucosidase [Chloroflexota bacterium]